MKSYITDLWKKEGTIQKMVLKQLDNHIKKIKINILHYILHKTILIKT